MTQHPKWEFRSWKWAKSA